jgi:hypothetical protein
MTQIEKIQKLLDSSVLFTLEQKEAWLKLLPKMNDSELEELFGILVDEVKELKKEGVDLIEDSKLESELLGSSESNHGASIEALKAAAQAVPKARVSDAFAKELKREVTTPELRKPTDDEMGIKKAPAIPKPVLRPSVATRLAPMPAALQVPRVPFKRPQVPTPSGGLRSIADIRTVDDLKRIQTDHLRQGELATQIGLIRSKIYSIAQANKLLPFYTVNAFEQSPLFKTYLTIGGSLILDPNPDRSNAFEKAVASAGAEKLTLREFEAVADLRKQIE